MATPPVILLAFANDPGEHLKGLKAERQLLEQLLEPLQDRGLLKLKILPDADTRDIIAALDEYGPQLVLFHYGGHAGSQSLRLTDKKASGATLAQLLAQAPNLELVVLNGCATLGQVKDLLAAGVRAAIATARPVQDQRAVDFARYFYSKLANFGSINQSVEFAQTRVSFSYEQSFGFVPVRDVEAEDFTALIAGKETVEWGLYHDPEQELRVKEWSLPRGEAVAYGRHEASERFQPNGYLDAILDYMGEQDDPDIQEAVKQAGKDELKRLGLIIEYFPWPISAQLSLLLSNEKDMLNPSLARLEQIVNTYLAAAQFNYFTLLADAWRLLRAGKLARPAAELEAVFGLEEAGLGRFDFLARARQLQRGLAEAGQTPFVKELAWLETVFDPRDEEQAEGQAAYLYLESLRERLLDGQEQYLSQNLLYTCADAEYALAWLLCSQAFWVNYKMVGIRDIAVDNSPHLPQPSFQHKWGAFHTQNATILQVNNETLDQPAFLNSRSVMLVRDPAQPQPALSLSPFFADKNAYTSAKSSAMNLYSFAFQTAGEGKYFYQACQQGLLHHYRQQGPPDRFDTGEEHHSELRAKRLKLRRSQEQEGEQPFAVLKMQLTQFQSDWQQSP